MEPVVALGASALFLLSIAGGAAPKCVAKLPRQWTELANAVAGGVILITALVHMLARGSEGLQEWNEAAAAFIKGEDEDHPGEEEQSGHGHLPLGNMLCVLGFFLVMLIEQWLPHQHEVAHEHDEEQDAEHSKTTISVVRKNGGVAALGTVIGFFFHSFIEGLAAGVAASPSVFVAIAAHKSFSAFAVGNALLPAAAPVWFWVGVVLFALSGVVGIFLGSSVAEVVEGPVTSALTCFAAGTLLCIGIVDMLLPSLASGGPWAKRKLAASLLASMAIAFLGIWG